MRFRNYNACEIKIDNTTFSDNHESLFSPNFSKVPIAISKSNVILTLSYSWTYPVNVNSWQF